MRQRRWAAKIEFDPTYCVDMLQTHLEPEAVLNRHGQKKISRILVTVWENASGTTLKQLQLIHVLVYWCFAVLFYWCFAVFGYMLFVQFAWFVFFEFKYVKTIGHTCFLVISIEVAGKSAMFCTEKAWTNTWLKQVIRSLIVCWSINAAQPT